MLSVVVGDHLPAPGPGGVVLEAPGVRALVAPPATSPRDPMRATVRALLDAAGWERADCYLQWTAEYRALPADALETTPWLAVLVGDWNVAGRMLRLLAPVADVALADRPGVPRVRRLGYPDVVEALPWGWDDAAWPLVAPAAERDIDVLFVGSRNPAIHGERERVLARLAGLAGAARVRIASDLAPGDYRALAARARIVLNRSVRGEANMRAFEAASAGACLLDERGNPTLADVFADGIEHATYGPDDLAETALALLADEPRRLAIAAAGQAAVVRHRALDHLRAALVGLADAIRERGAPRPRPARLAGARVLAEQWRLATEPTAWGRAAPLLAAAGAPQAEVARMRAVVAPALPDATAAEIETSWALAAGAAPDAALLLARAEAARASGAGADLAWAAGRVLAADADAAGLDLPVPGFGDWRLPLERAVLEAADDAAASRLAAAWARARAGWHVATSAGRSLPPAERLALLAPGPVDPVPLRAERATALVACGRLADAIDLLDGLVRERPFADELRRDLAAWLVLAGRRVEAAATLRAHAALLAAVDGAAGLAAALTAEADALADPPRVAWTWCRDAQLVAAIRLRAAGAVPGDVLRVAVPPGRALDEAAAAAGTALDAAGLAARDLPPTEIVADATGGGDRAWQLAGAAAVIAPDDAAEARLARRLGVPVIAPVLP